MRTGEDLNLWFALMVLMVASSVVIAGVVAGVTWIVGRLARRR